LKEVKGGGKKGGVLVVGGDKKGTSSRATEGGHLTQKLCGCGDPLGCGNAGLGTENGESTKKGGCFYTTIPG